MRCPICREQQEERCRKYWEQRFAPPHRTGLGRNMVAAAITALLMAGGWRLVAWIDADPRRVSMLLLLSLTFIMVRLIIEFICDE